MKEICVINIIHVPHGMEAEAERVREVYVAYFRQQKGFVRSTFYRETDVTEPEKEKGSKEQKKRGQVYFIIIKYVCFMPRELVCQLKTIEMTLNIIK